MTTDERTPTTRRLSDIGTSEVERRIIAMFARNEGDADTIHEAFASIEAEARAPLLAALRTACEWLEAGTGLDDHRVATVLRAALTPPEPVR